MSGKLVGEVVEWLMTPAATPLTAAERCVLFIIAERANPETREMWRHRVDDQNLYDRIASALGAKDPVDVFKRLAKRGLEVRVPVGEDKNGRPVFATRGRPARFVLPEFPASVELPSRERVGQDPPFPVDNPPSNPVDNSSGGERKGRSQPTLSSERVGHSPPFDRERVGQDRPLIPLRAFPSKKNPSDSDGPVSQPDVEGASAGDNEPSARRDLPRDGPDTAAYDAARAYFARFDDCGTQWVALARSHLGYEEPLSEIFIYAHRLATRTATTRTESRTA